MKKINLYLLLANLALYIFDIILLLANKIDANYMKANAHIVIIFFLSSSFYFYLRPKSVRWFGEKLDKDHDAGAVVGHLISCMCLFPAFIFIIGPIVNTF